MLIRLGICMGLLLACSAAGAQTMYVTDELVITLRTGPSNQNRVIANLTSSDALEMLEQGADDDYSRVRVVSSGMEGWVLTRYLSAQPTAALRLADAERELRSASRRAEDLEEELADATSALEIADKELLELRASNTALSSELSDIRSASANAIALRDQNESLRRRINEMQLDLEQLEQQTTVLARRSRQNWFIVGAGVLAVGIVIGLVAPTLRRRRAEW